MKGTDHFKRTIQMYLEQRAEEDTLFAKKYRNPAKNIDECVTHILNHVQKSGCNGFTDGEIFGQAIHYYEEKRDRGGQTYELPSGGEPCCGTHGRGKGGGTSECSPQIPRGGTPQVAEPQQTVSEKRKPPPTLII